MTLRNASPSSLTGATRAGVVPCQRRRRPALLRLLLGLVARLESLSLSLSLSFSLSLSYIYVYVCVYVCMYKYRVCVLCVYMCVYVYVSFVSSLWMLIIVCSAVDAAGPTSLQRA